MLSRTLRFLGVNIVPVEAGSDDLRDPAGSLEEPRRLLTVAEDGRRDGLYEGGAVSVYINCMCVCERVEAC